MVKEVAVWESGKQTLSVLEALSAWAALERGGTKWTPVQWCGFVGVMVYDAD